MLDKEVITSICEDLQHNIWVATTSKGILKFNQDAVLIDSINADNGLPLNQVNQVGADDMGRIWATTSEGLYYINPVNKKIAELDVDMGEPLHDPIGVFSIRANKLYATMVNKLAIINLAKVGKFSAMPEPMISGISVFEQEAPVPGIKQALQLNYDENFFVIEFSSPNHHDISSLEYAYKLVPFDKDWVYCGHRQTASYTNVPSGRYTFLVKCTDANGQWVQRKDPVHIIVKPAFWNTWWFTGIIVLLILLAAWKLYQVKIRNNRKSDIDKTIDYFANSVYGQNSINEICWDIARNCISQLHFEDCVVYLFDEKRKVLVQKAAYGPKNPKGQEIVAPIELTPGTGIAGTVAETGKPLLIADTTKDSRYIVHDEKRLSQLAVPILHDGEVIGVIDSENSKRNYFTEAHMKALSTIASISANKIAEAKAEALVKENEIKVLEINKMLAESQLMAMRAQMNPHFVFNCLNSIQECIVTQKYGEASNYLNKFSKLFRMVLNNSGRKLISLDEEKEVLELYLQLELMRFEKSFSYKIIIDEELDTSEVLIPSMLLQPYVENALWHGLMHKDGERILQIEFKSLSEDVFACIVEDNGIGRKRSFDLKAEQSKTKRHESKGLKISSDRLEVIQKQGYHATLQIIDKYDDNQQPAGTKIIIELSTELIN